MRELKPMATSDVLDASFQIYRKHFMSFFVVSVVAYSLYFVVQMGIYFGMRGFILDLANEGSKVDPLQIASVMIVFMFGTMIGSIASMVGLSVASIMVTTIARDLYLDTPMVPLGDRLRLALRLFFPLVVTNILFSIFFLLWLLLLIVPGIIYAFRRCLFAQVVVFEGRVGMKALQRARELIRIPAGPGFWKKGETRAAIFFLVFLIVGTSAIAVTVIPKMILAAIYGSYLQDRPPGAVPLDQFAQFAIPPVWMVLLNLVDVVVYAFLLPISTICFVIFYYEQRVRGEGFGAPPKPETEPAADDLELADGAVEAGPA